ncbi:MAG TPA: cupredoxin family copper-binding protein [Stellaceae bacterium]|nr:cupredoxin family copper-binding protein [Stellaceae bacterium]
MLPILFRRAVLMLGGAMMAGILMSAAADAADKQVTIDNFTFSPVEIHVAAGDKITWTNRDDIPHTVVDSDDPKRMKSSPLDTGDSFAHVFDKPGTYHYFCSLHPHMQGMLVVQ